MSDTTTPKRKEAVAQRFRYTGMASWCYTDTVISETVSSLDGFSNENLYSQETVDALERELELARGWNGDPHVTCKTALDNAHSVADALRERIAAWHGEVSRLRSKVEGARVLAQHWQGMAAESWGEDKRDAALQSCCDELLETLNLEPPTDGR